MPRRRIARLPTILIALAIALQATAATVAAAPQRASPYIVALADSVRAASVAASAQATPTHFYERALNGFAADLTPGQVRALEHNPHVQAVIPDAVVALSPPSLQVTQQPPQVVDTGVRRIGGLESQTARIDGTDERIDADVAVLDTGVDVDHPDLNVAGGHDCVKDGSAGFDDQNGHGTFVAGLAGAIDNDIGTVGVAPGARVWGIRVLNASGSGLISWVLCGLEWVALHSDKIDVANLSFGGAAPGTENCGVPLTEDDPEEVDIIHAVTCLVVATGVTVVVAAGNDGSDASNQIPAAYPEVITVSALSDSDGEPGGEGGPPECLPEARDDELAFFSNNGEPIDIAAPGVCITSTFIGGEYAVGSGTSFSTPLVAGAAALIYSTEPSVTPLSVRGILLDEAEPGPIPDDPDDFPEGILDAGDL